MTAPAPDTIPAPADEAPSAAAPAPAPSADSAHPLALLFDFDGVLVDSEPLHWRTICETLTSHDLPAVPWADYERDLMGLDDRDAFRHATPPGTPELIIAQYVEEKAKRFATLAEEGLVPPRPGAADAVRRAAATGLPLALCSGALRTDVLPVLRHMAITTAFPIIITADDVAHSKPDPETYRLAIEKLAVPPERALVFEDTLDGLLSARAAHIPVWGITTHLPPSVLLSHGARTTFPSIASAIASLFP